MSYYVFNDRIKDTRGRVYLETTEIGNRNFGVVNIAFHYYISSSW